MLKKLLVTCLVLIAAAFSLPVANADTVADVAGIPSCTTSFSNATPAVASCGSVGLGSTGGFASANFNALAASASTGTSSANIISNAQFTDLATFSPSGTGTGFLGLTASLDGTITGAGGGATDSGHFTVSFNDTVACSVNITQNGTSGSNCLYYLPVTFGVTQQIAITGSLTVQSKFGGAADFSHTAEISAVDLYDANKNLIGPVELIGASGTTYGAPPTLTPEPSTIILLSTGLLGLMGMTWRKKLFA